VGADRALVDAWSSSRARVHRARSLPHSCGCRLGASPGVVAFAESCATAAPGRVSGPRGVVLDYGAEQIPSIFAASGEDLDPAPVPDSAHVRERAFSNVWARRASEKRATRAPCPTGRWAALRAGREAPQTLRPLTFLIAGYAARLMARRRWRP